MNLSNLHALKDNDIIQHCSFHSIHHFCQYHLEDVYKLGRRQCIEIFEDSDEESDIPIVIVPQKEDATQDSKEGEL